MKPLFKYCGSKARISNWIVDNFPQTPCSYYEPFFGGGSVFCELHNRGLITSSHINDIDTELILLYQTLKTNYNSFIEETQKVYDYLANGDVYRGRFKASGLPNKDAYNNIKEHYAFSYGVLTNVEKSARLYVMMKFCFNGMKKKYKKYNGLFSTPPGIFPKTFKVLDLGLLEEWHLALQTANITSEPVDLNNNSDLVYFDPPYRSCSIDYENSFDDEALLGLISFIRNRPNAYLSNWLDDNEWWKNNTNGLILKEINLNHTAGRGVSNNRVKEILVYQ